MINILAYLEQSAARNPDKIAVADPEKALTYRELLSFARKTGSAIARITPPRTPAAVYLPKSVESVVAFLGAVYAGCFYCQIDTKQPASRVNSILGTLDTGVVLTERSFAERFESQPDAESRDAEALADAGTGHAEAPAEDGVAAASAEAGGIAKAPEEAATVEERFAFSGKVLYVEEMADWSVDEGALAAIRTQACDTDPLYCNFTSGSTGVPKGVLVAHRSVIDFIDCFTEIFGITESDVIGNQAPFDFDVSVKDLYSTLKCGATMQIIPTRYFSVPMTLLDYLVDRHVTTLIWAVSALCLVSQLHGFSYKVPSEVKKVIFSGEVMPIKQLNIWRAALPEAMFVNVYGPTEITCNCTYYIVDRDFVPGDVLPMGRAFPNERVFLLDEEDHLIAPPEEGRIAEAGAGPCQDGEKAASGSVGEVCVAGTALSLGYYKDPEATARAFVQNPLQSAYPEIIYRTGDLAEYNKRGELCFVSRKDFQIKHMGHRIELGEIEAAMDAIPELERAACLFVKNKIIAFYTGSLDKREIVQRLKKTLPDYMVPNVFRAVEAMPLTKNGKIDRKALEGLL